MITHPMMEAQRSALIGDTEIASRLAQYKNEPAVFTRRPIPEELGGKVVAIINPALSLIDWDALNVDRPLWENTIAFYGPKAAPGSTSDKTRIIEELGDLTRELFHRERFSLTVAGFSVIDIVAGGPVPGPTDDDSEVARIVRLRIRLRRN